MNPFTVLGLPTSADLTDEQVRAAWRAIAAATHPDRPDGGDIARYTAAANAYAQLRTAWGRSEAYADLAAEQPYIPAPAAPLPVSPGARLPAQPGWSRPASGTAGPGICWPAPSPPRSCRSWRWACCRASRPGRPW